MAQVRPCLFSAASNNTDRCRFRVLHPEWLKVVHDDVVQQSPFHHTADSSCYFIGAPSPIYSRDIQTVFGDFLPLNPYWFFVAHGRFDTPWLYFEAFRMCVTLGPLLHHEKGVSLFRARTLLRESNQWISPLFTIIIPHHLTLPVWFPPFLHELYQYTNRAEVKDLDVPQVEIISQVPRVWKRDIVQFGPCTEIQAGLAIRLGQSWARRSVRGKDQKSH